MSYLSQMPLARAFWLFIIVLAILLGGTWATIQITTDQLLNRDAQDNARDWAKFVAVSVTDLEQIAAGEQPSSQSLAFFRTVGAVGHVFRCIVYNPQGYSQLVADANGVSQVDIAERDEKAVRAVESGMPVVDMRSSPEAGMPGNFAEAFVPVELGGRPIAIIAAFVDQTAQRKNLLNVIRRGAIAVCALTGLSFGIPAIAWYRRTREKQRADSQIQFLAHHDTLTGLVNRARLIERLDTLIGVLPATGGILAVHHIGIDYFKRVNDTLGHNAGDFILNSIADRLRTMVRTQDMVSRFGGDEFLILQTGLDTRTQAREFAERIAAAIAMPVPFRDQKIKLTATIGIATAPADGVTSEYLLKNADLALHDGKTHGRNCISFFTPDMDVAMRERVKLERIIRNALDDNTFQVYYQPIFERRGNLLVGFEALARLPAPDGSFIPPATFIPLAEELRLIDRLGEWILREACNTARSWPETLKISVNLSPAQFESGAIKDAVARALKDTGLEPRRLELEITERLLLDNTEAIMATLRRFKEMGVSIVMDDFGTGYSSLSYLWKFPFDKIKIDRSFMEGFEKSGRDVETVVRTIIALGRELNMRVTVEGVETAEQVEFLYNAKADQMQGFYFGRPLPASEVAANIMKNYRKSLMPAADDEAKPGQIKASA